MPRTSPGVEGRIGAADLASYMYLFPLPHGIVTSATQKMRIALAATGRARSYAWSGSPPWQLLNLFTVTWQEEAEVRKDMTCQ
jgi:hypothetical protein